MPSVHVGNLDLFYQDHDFADPWLEHDTVLIQHGFARNSDIWWAWVPWLSRDYRVVRPDMRGCGFSSDPGPDYRFSVDDLLGDLIGLLDALKIERVHYIGESLGGILGVLATVRHPERFKSLTVISTPLQINKNAQQALSVGFPSRAEAFRTLGMKGWWLKYREACDELVGIPAADDYLSSLCARTPLHIGLALQEFAESADISSLLTNISVPTLVLTPGRSAVVTSQMQADIINKIPNVRQKIYEGAGHSMYHLIPDTLAKDTLEFLRSLR